MVNATHTEAVAVLKDVREVCRMVVSREVLVVLPEEQLEKTEGERREAACHLLVYNMLCSLFFDAVVRTALLYLELGFCQESCIINNMQ